MATFEIPTCKVSWWTEVAVSSFLFKITYFLPQVLIDFIIFCLNFWIVLRRFTEPAGISRVAAFIAYFLLRRFSIVIMLHRGDRKLSNRLSRRKSTSSVYSKEAYIDPDIAQQHAQAAATHAFARAQERESAEIRSGNGLFRKSGTPEQPRASLHNNTKEQAGRGVRREQSVRFVGPTAIQRTQSIGTRSLLNPIDKKTSNASLRPRALTIDVPVPAAYRPPSRSSSIGKTSISKATAESFVSALAAYDEYYTREDDVASTPSSYRRIRKSKSLKVMFTPMKAPSVLCNNGTAGSDYNAKIWNRVPWLPNQQDQALRAPKSMSFLRGGRDHMTPAVREDRDAAVQIARDKFLQQIEQQRLREQPSFLFRSKARREQRPFRKSVRTSSTNSYSIPVASANQNIPPKEGSLRIKAYRTSQTIKKRLKNLFRRGGDEKEEAFIPNQQVEACKSHGDDTDVSPANVLHGEFLDIPLPDVAIVSRVASRVPSLHTVPSSQQLRSRTGSVRSLQSDGSGKSRVTSWTSTKDNTATSRHTQAERERQRLSIIQENGTHVSSTSFGRSALSNQFSAYPVFHRPRNYSSHVPPIPGPVDSQRVYSALMKRLDENSPKAKLGAQRMASVERFGPPNRIPARSSSVNSRHSSPGSRTPATIRHVQYDSTEPMHTSQKHEETLTSPPHDNDDVFSPTPSTGAASSTVPRRCRSVSSEQTVLMSRIPSYSAYPPLEAGNGTALTPQQMAARNELRMKPSKVLRETRSTFFGNSSVTIQRTTSPYRRALAEADYNPAAIRGEEPVGTSPNRAYFAPPIMSCSDPKPNESQEERDEDRAYTESVYSRTTSGCTPAAESPGSLALADDDFPLSNIGSMILIDGDTYQPMPPQNRATSSVASTEWRGCLPSKVIALEKGKEINETDKINYALPSMPKAFGHIREHAQITDEDIEVAQQRVSMPKQPLGIIQQNAQIKSILKNKSSLPVIEIPAPPPPPPMPVRSSLRPTQSRSSLHSIGTTNTELPIRTPSSAIRNRLVKSHPLLRAQSSATLRDADTPAKRTKRNGRAPNNCNPSLGIVAAVEKQFGSSNSRTAYSGAENCSPAGAARDEQYGSDGAGLMGPVGIDAQAMSSKRMVDLFLSSRRRRVAGSDESNAFL